MGNVEIRNEHLCRTAYVYIRQSTPYQKEVSRFARNNREWYHLLDLCALFDTLIADQEGLYHPGNPNDRMVLGLYKNSRGGGTS